jgi:hypothetical protein
MDRSLAIGATSGSFTALLLRLFSAAVDPQSCPASDLICDCPHCLELPQLLIQGLDIYSLLIGIVVGLPIGPVLDLLHLVRQSWAVWLRSKLAQLAEEKPLYRLA